MVVRIIGAATSLLCAARTLLAAPKRAAVLVLEVGCFVGLGDLATKLLASHVLVAHHPVWLLGHVAGFDLVKHEGIGYPLPLFPGALGIASMIVLAAVAGLWCDPAIRQWVAALCGAALAGIVANNVDGMLDGSVYDWLILNVGGHNAVVNLADVSIMACGSAATVMLAFGMWKRGALRR